jgi:hypothetical protein
MEQKPNSLEQKYTEESLAKDMEEWRDLQLSWSSDDVSKEYVRNLTSLKLFNVYQNNFWEKFKTARELYDASGSVKPEQKEWAETLEKKSAVGGTLYYDLRKIITELGLGKFGNPMRDGELEIVKKVYMQMRNLGYTYRELR